MCSLLTSIIFFLIFCSTSLSFFFFFNDTATTEIYTLSLHDALPISAMSSPMGTRRKPPRPNPRPMITSVERSEEHTSELQSPDHLVCRLLLEKKKKKRLRQITSETKVAKTYHVTVATTRPSPGAAPR